MHLDPGSRRRVVLAIAIIVLLVLAGCVAAFLILRPSGNTSPVVVDDGPTLYEALGSVNDSVATLSGGPWVLSQVYGVASPLPVNPGAWGWGEYDGTLASCQVDFNGLTIWNGTLPLFHGTFDSGTAPFWQVVFFSNASQQLLVTTDLEGEVHLFPPIPLSSSCATYSGLATNPWLTSLLFRLDGFPGNTPAMASDAWNAVAKQYVDWLGKTPAEMYLLGSDPFGSGQGAGTQIQFFTCGVVGWAGATPGLSVYGSAFNSSQGFNAFNYTLGCTPTADNWTSIPLQLEFSNFSTATNAETTAARSTFQFREFNASHQATPGFNIRGVTSWMIGLNLSSSCGQRLPLAPSMCSAWVASLRDCPANSSGWYAVLLSPNGQWDGWYGTTPDGPAWSYPVLPVVNNESIAVVVPSSWSLSGDQMVVDSTTAILPLTGSADFP